MKIVQLDSAKFPEVLPGDTLTVKFTQDGESSEYTSTRQPYDIRVYPVNGGWLLRNTDRSLKVGPLFFVPHDNALEAVAAIVALMADDRL